MENKQTSLQDEIRKIQRDTTIPQKDKPKMISELMKNFNKKHLDKNSDKDENGNNVTNSSKKIVTAADCKHYSRGCDMKCPTCHTFYPCRLCHDENEDHKLDRFKVDTVRCRLCQRTQAPSQHCIYCRSIFGFYYCNTCHLWDNSGKDIFHCDKCGICRLGKREDWIHCDKCNHCYSKGFTHKCINDNTKNNCPVCNEYLFDSQKPVSILKCGHAIHSACLEKLLKHDYRCPLCKKTVVDKIKEQWKVYDMLSEFEPIPPDFKDKRLVILCNDCEKKSDIKFSFEFLKCAECGGYNTSEVDMYDSVNSSDNAAAGNVVIG